MGWGEGIGLPKVGCGGRGLHCKPDIEGPEKASVDPELPAVGVQASQ